MRRVVRRGWPEPPDGEDVMTMSEFVEALDKGGFQPEKEGNGWRSRCPAHDGDGKSLTFEKGDKVPVVATCWARGCDWADITAAVAEVKIAPERDASRNGSKKPKPKLLATYDYTENGTSLRRVYRWDDPKDRFSQSVRDDRYTLLHLDEVRNWVEEGETVYLCEGESDAEAMIAAGAKATCSPQGAQSRHKLDQLNVDLLAKAKKLVVVGDNDDAGRNGAAAIADRLREAGANVEVAYPPQECKDVRDLLEDGGSIDDLAQSLEELHVEPGEEVLPAFPVEELPPPLGELLASVSRAFQVPSDLTLVLALGTVAAATVGRLVVDVRPGWTEAVNLFVGAIARSGERKTPLISYLTDPVLATERALREASQNDILRAEVQKDTLEAAATEARKKAGKRVGDETLLEEAQQAAIEAAFLDVPLLPSLVCFDATTERITTLAFEQGGRLAVIGDEGTPLDIAAGYYKKQPNFGSFLKGYDGGWYRRDRQTGREHEGGRIAINMILAVQPQVIRFIAAAPGAKERGLLARFLIAEPQSDVGWREENPPPVPQHLGNWWEGFIDDVVRHYWPRQELERVTLDKAAGKRLSEFRTWAERERRPGGCLDVEQEWSHKLDGRVVRIAAILALVRSGPDEILVVSGEDMALAVRLGEWSISHAARVLGHRLEDIVDLEIQDDARRILDWLKRQPYGWIKKRDIQRLSPVRSRSRIDDALHELEDEGKLDHRSVQTSGPRREEVRLR